jgi:DNA-binding transcriptional LysR family regulator
MRVDPDLRLIRYFVAVGMAGNVTRAAETLHVSQPSLSAALKQLEQRLGVELLERSGRGIALTSAGSLLLLRGRELIDRSEVVFDEIRARGNAPAGRVQIGMAPAARYGIGPELVARCTATAPAAMLYTREDTTDALLRDVAHNRLDCAITFCAPEQIETGTDLVLLREEPAALYVPAGHRLADRLKVSIADLENETIIVGSSSDALVFSERLLAAFAAVGVEPKTAVHPYPDLGLQAVREGLGVLLYPCGAFPRDVPGIASLGVDGSPLLPFHLAVREDATSAALRAVAGTASQMAATRELAGA